MRPTKLMIIALVLFVLASPLLGGGRAVAAFADIDHNWAKEAIVSLEAQGLFEDLWLESFVPSASVSHAELFALLAGAFQLTEEDEQALTTWLGDLLVGHQEGVTRGEFAAALANLLGLGEQADVPQGFYASFADVSLDYPGFMGVEVLQRLALLPTHMVGRFEPYRLITRSEAAFILAQAKELQAVKGLVAEVAEGGKQFTVSEAEGDKEFVFTLLNETLYVAPGSLTRDSISKDGQLEKGQNVVVLARNNHALLINLEQVSTAQVLMDGLNNATKVLVDVLTPAQINAIIAGDWDQLGEEVNYTLYEQLVDRGVSPWEADALLKQDWDSVQLMLQDRLTQEAADYLKVAPELVQAAVSQDWQRLLEYAQAELAQRLLTSDWLKEATATN
ncbi:MAG: hypothetical protein M0R49_11555 [Limnochordia bacterium]|nr:hypothetical protein [Limnochordia bacterium]